MKVIDFITFLVDLSTDVYGEKLDGHDAKYFYLHGGCYYFACLLKYYYKDEIIMINKEYNHCAIKINNQIYDASGLVEDITNYNEATKQDIEYIKDNFGIRELANKNGKSFNDIIIEELEDISFFRKI